MGRRGEAGKMEPAEVLGFLGLRVFQYFTSISLVEAGAGSPGLR